MLYKKLGEKKKGSCKEYGKMKLTFHSCRGQPQFRGGGGGGYSLVMCYWGCVAGWGHIFTTQLTITGSPFQAFSILKSY